MQSLDPSLHPEVAINLTRTYPEKSSTQLDQMRTNYLNHPNNKEIKTKYVTALYDEKKLKEALYLYDSLLKSEPDNIDNLGMVSNTCLSLEFYDIAMTKIKKAKDLSNDSQGWIIQNVGNLLNNKGFYTEAIEWLKKGLALETDSAYAHERLSAAIKSQKEERKKYNEACEEGKKLIQQGNE